MNSAAWTCRSDSAGGVGLLCVQSGQQNGGFRLNQSSSAAVAIPDACLGGKPVCSHASPAS